MDVILCREEKFFSFPGPILSGANDEDISGVIGSAFAFGVAEDDEGRVLLLSRRRFGASFTLAWVWHFILMSAMLSWKK